MSQTSTPPGQTVSDCKTFASLCFRLSWLSSIHVSHCSLSAIWKLKGRRCLGHRAIWIEVAHSIFFSLVTFRFNTYSLISSMPVILEYNSYHFWNSTSVQHLKCVRFIKTQMCEVHNEQVLVGTELLCWAMWLNRHNTVHKGETIKIFAVNF